MKKKYFGTDGIRGRVGTDIMNPQFVLKLGWAVGKVLANNHHAKVLIGKDTRVSGYMFEAALEAGLAAAGVNTLLLGPMPTPAVAYLTHSLRADASIVISASHNPYYDNGLKFFDCRGMKLSDELEQEIEKYIEMPMETVDSEHLGKAKRVDDAAGRYIEFCKSIFPSQLSLKDLKIVIDCAHGAAYDVAPKILYELGAEVIAIGNQPDGFNINKDCGATHLSNLQTVVLDNKADLGVALDGDGDRLIMVDHKGEIVDGDELLCILAKDRVTGIGSKTGVVGTLMSNLGLEQALASASIAFERVNVGDRHVLAKLLEKGWVLGGEASGHIVDLDYTTTGDGVITALQVLRIMQHKRESLHTMKKVMTKHPQILINVPIKAPIDLSDFPEIHSSVQQVEQELDGNGRVLLRSSGTEPLIRVMVEGHDHDTVQQKAEFIAKSVEKAVSKHRE